MASATLAVYLRFQSISNCQCLNQLNCNLSNHQVIEIARSMQLNAVDLGSLKMANNIENKPLELFPSWRVALAMVGVLYFIILLSFVLKRVVKKIKFTNFPLRSMSLINARSLLSVSWIWFISQDALRLYFS